jgi:hypothetical protein
MRNKKWEYFGDCNVENGGYWINTENLQFGYADYVEVIEAGTQHWFVDRGVVNMPDTEKEIDGVLANADMEREVDAEGKTTVIRTVLKGEWAKDYWEAESHLISFELFILDLCLMQRFKVEPDSSQLVFIPDAIQADKDDCMEGALRLKSGTNLNTWVPNKFIPSRSVRKPGW